MNACSRAARWLLPLVCLTVLLATANTAQACPSCQRALSDGSQGDLARGIYYSILFMMSMPFAIFGTFAGFMYRAVKVEQRRVAAEAEAKSQQQPEA